MDDENGTGRINNKRDGYRFHNLTLLAVTGSLQSKKKRQIRTAYQANMPATRLAASAINNSMPSAGRLRRCCFMAG